MTAAKKKAPKQTSGARVIAIANQKGGVGKSTTTVSIGAAMAEAGHPVLVIDLDPQGNASTGMGIKHEDRGTTIYEILVAEAPIEDAITPTVVEGLDAVPSTIDLAGAEIELVSQFSRELRLQKALEPVVDRYDYVLIDCPPSINTLTLNALTAADGVLIPIQCEYYALEGLSSLLETIKQVRNTVNNSLRIEGLLRTMYDPRNRLAAEVSTQLLKHFPDKVYEAIIPRNVRLAEAPSFGLSAILHDRSSRGAQAYVQLAEEIIRRDAGEK
jgi:chromosome partitioning protein